MAKQKKTMKYPIPRRPQGSWTRLLLALTLVPLVVGVLLIGAWVLDITIFDDPQAQSLIGLLFILFSFAGSNALQKKRDLAIGWALLTVSDLVLLLWVELWAQIAAFIFALVGLGFLAVVFYRSWKAEQSKAGKKK